MSEVKRVGLYGGTFSPVHVGHVSAAKAFMEQGRLAELTVIPAGIPPHKAFHAEVSAEHRLEMCRLAFSELPHTGVSDMEIRREGKSYTVLTLRALQKEGIRLVFLCGTDMLLTLDQWYCFEEIFQLAEIAFVRREHSLDVLGSAREKIDRYRSQYGATITEILAPPIEVASAEIRARLSAGKEISGMVPPKVEQYIKTWNLYQKKKS